MSHERAINMGQLINLRHRRKARARITKEDRAAQNRIAFGRSRNERAQTKAQAVLDARTLDGAQRNGDVEATDQGGKPE